MNKLTKQQAEWLVSIIRSEESKHTGGCSGCNARISTSSILHIINQCTEKEFPEYNSEYIAVRLDHNKEVRIFMRETELEFTNKVDAKDYDWIILHNWYASTGGRKWYAASTEYQGNRQKAVYMHRIIMKAAEEEVDHINGDTLDNRRENLRLVTHQQNLFNQKSQHGRTSKYKGVYKANNSAGWVVQIKHGQRTRTINGIENEDIAGFIYDLLALDRFKEFARFNFPEAIEAWNERT